MDKGNQKVFRFQLLCEEESEKRDELKVEVTLPEQLAQKWLVRCEAVMDIGRRDEEE